MKDHNLKIAPTRIYLPTSQCYGKKPYNFKRRALKDAQTLSKETGKTYTIYECPHCGKFHVGKVRV